MIGIRASRLHAIALAGAVMALTPAALAQSLPSASAAEAAPADAVPPSIAALDTNSAATAASAAPETGTPLVLRPSKPLELAHEPPPSSLGWKLVAFAALLGGAVWYARKKLWVKPSEDAQLTIVRRATIGLRTELLVVNVEGQRLLLGVTPNSIQSLAVLDADEPSPSPAIAERPAAAASFGDRFAAMLDAAETQTTPSTSRAQSASSPVASAALGAYVATAPAEKPAPRARRARTATAANGANGANVTKPAANPPPVPAAEEEPEVGSQARGLLALRRSR